LEIAAWSVWLLLVVKEEAEEDDLSFDNPFRILDIGKPHMFVVKRWYSIMA
jgi:hypothetical protein